VRTALRRTLVTALGAGLLVAGALMVVLPGPGLVVSVAGLAVLATEFRWAENLLDRCRAPAVRATAALTASRSAMAALVASSVAMVTVGIALMWSAEGARVAGATLAASGVFAAATLSATVRRRLGLEPPAAAPAAAAAPVRAGGPGR